MAYRYRKGVRYEQWMDAPLETYRDEIAKLRANGDLAFAVRFNAEKFARVYRASPKDLARRAYICDKLRTSADEYGTVVEPVGDCGEMHGTIKEAKKHIRSQPTTGSNEQWIVNEWIGYGSIDSDGGFLVERDDFRQVWP